MRQCWRSPEGDSTLADVTMPQLGETVTEGTITKWLKAVGEAVARDEPLFEVSTDKVDSEVPSPAAGTLAEIRVQEGETVDVGTVLAVVSADGAGAAAPARPGTGCPPPAGAAAPPPPPHRLPPAPAPPPPAAPPAAAHRAAPAPAPAAPQLRRRTRAASRRPREVGRPDPVAGGAPVARRQRDRPGGDHRDGPRRPGHAVGRARLHRQPSCRRCARDGGRSARHPHPRHGRAAGARAAVDSASQRPPPAPTRSSPSPTSAGGPPSTWSGRRRRAHTPWWCSKPTTSRSNGSGVRRARSSRPRRASRSRTSPSWPGPRSRRCTSGRTSTPRWATTRSSCTISSTWGSPSTSTTTG